jgi:excisionase family DNA binding protein
MPTEIAGKKFYSLEEVAESLGVHYQTVKMWRAQEKLKAIKIGRSYRVADEEFQRILTEGVTAPHRDQIAA